MDTQRALPHKKVQPMLSRVACLDWGGMRQMRQSWHWRALDLRTRRPSWRVWCKELRHSVLKSANTGQLAIGAAQMLGNGCLVFKFHALLPATLYHTNYFFSKKKSQSSFSYFQQTWPQTRWKKLASVPHCHPPQPSFWGSVPGSRRGSVFVPYISTEHFNARRRPGEVAHAVSSPTITAPAGSPALPSSLQGRWGGYPKPIS